MDALDAVGESNVHPRPASRVRSVGWRHAVHTTAGRAVGDDPAAARASAVRSIRAAFAQPGTLERTVHHAIGDMPGRQLLVQLVAGCVACSWDLATAIGVDPGLDERLIELSYEF
jgi:uncharacterized protein (TIGR03086 family)